MAARNLVKVEGCLRWETKYYTVNPRALRSVVSVVCEFSGWVSGMRGVYVWVTNKHWTTFLFRSHVVSSHGAAHGVQLRYAASVLLVTPTLCPCQPLLRYALYALYSLYSLGPRREERVQFSEVCPCSGDTATHARSDPGRTFTDAAAVGSALGS